MEVIYNELLLYAKHYLDSSIVDNIKKMILHFYEDTEIVDAKKALWAVRGDHLGNYMERKSTDNRPARVANVKDIVEALTKLDSIDQMPIIAAINLNRIPDRQPEELNLLTIVDRVAQLERSIGKQNDTLSSLAIDIMELKDRPKSYSEAINSCPQFLKACILST